MTQATLNENVGDSFHPADGAGTKPVAEASLEPTPQFTSTMTSGLPAEPEVFDYKPVPVIAPVAFFLGVASSLALYTELALPICLLALVLSLVAVWKIRTSDGEFGGLKLAGIGLATSVLFFVTGIASFVHAYTTEVPEGHLRVNFPRDISDKQFVYQNGVRQLHPDVAPLEGKQIYIKGWMYNTRRQKGLDGFVLLKDNGQCCFGGNPKPFDMIEVSMVDGKTVDRIDGMIAVAGTLQCNPHSAGAVYRLKATQVKPAPTRY